MTDRALEATARQQLRDLAAGGGIKDVAKRAPGAAADFYRENLKPIRCPAMQLSCNSGIGPFDGWQFGERSDLAKTADVFVAAAGGKAATLAADAIRGAVVAQRAARAAKAVPGAAAAARIEVTEDVARAAMQGAPLRTQQGRVSLPAVQRYVDRLRAGEVPPAIKVDGDIIVDGNHRYIAGRIVGREPARTPYAGGRPDRAKSFDEMQYDPVDWGNR